MRRLVENSLTKDGKHSLFSRSNLASGNGPQPQKTPSALRKKLSAFTYLTGEELDRINALEQRPRTIQAGREFICSDHHDQRAYILNKGWVYTYKLLADGSRQVLSFHLPGDFIALNRVVLRTWNRGAVALTDIEVCEIQPRDITDVLHTQPKLATAILWALSRDTAIAEEHLVDLGRRSALVRTAHFLIELGARLRLVGLASEDGYHCPINQSLLADALGISAIHLNRILRQLREKGCLTFRQGYVSLDNPQRLMSLAQYDGGYLDQDIEPALV